MVKGEAARAEIVADVGSVMIVVKHLDLASMASIRAFAKDILACEFTHLLLLLTLKRDH
jgi:hypothetical protein